MSSSSEKSLCTSEEKDAQERNSETRANENEETQKDERRNLLSRCLAKKIYPSDFKHWPILSLLKPEFTMQIRMVMVYGIRGTRALIVTKDKNVYALNYNEDDRVKIGKIDVYRGIHPAKIEELCGKNIKTFACNLYLVLALTEEGEVFSWGFDKERESDFGSRTTVLPLKPTRVAGLSKKCIVDVACGRDHSLALTSDGKVYAWGENKYGQIGKGAGTGDSQPRQVKHELEGKKIVHIACGSMFNMVVTDKGELYGWGDNKRSQILVNNTTSHSTNFGFGIPAYDLHLYDFYVNCAFYNSYLYPRKITAISGKVIVKVACGFEHTLVLTDEGKIYAWGKNDRGQLGVNNNLGISAPIMVNVPELVSDIAAYDNLSVAVSNNKTVYIWGDYFGESIAIPIPTGFSTIHNAFSTMRAMRKPLIVSMNSDVDEVLNLLESLGTLFDDPTKTRNVRHEEQLIKVKVDESIIKLKLINTIRRETQKDERRNLLSRCLAKKIYPSDFKHWPILSLLKPEFTMQIRMVMVYGIRGTRALIVTKDKNVYALNYNEDDRVKIGKIDVYRGIHPAKIEELCGKNIKTFACNLYLVLALTEEGEVFSWGFDKERESDFGSRTTVLPLKPTRVAGLSKKCIVDVACGRDHSLALTSDGKVYAWGENKYGQIGKGAGTGDSQPRQVKHELEGKKIVHIACGSMFNMVVTDKGKLYGWGYNDCGQISVDIGFRFRRSLFGSAGATLDIVKPEKYYVYPREITAVSDKTIVKVACGSGHTLALTDEGKIYSWGNNDDGQLGVSHNSKISAPIMVDVPELVLDIAADADLSVAVGSYGTVYVWGDCFGQDISTPFPTEFSRIHYAFAYSINSSVMHKPLTVSTNNDVEEVLNILESLEFGVLGTAFDDPSTSDFIVQVEGQSIHVHKGILKIRCQHFKNKFQHDWTDQSIPDPSAVYTISDKFSYI
ncbi:rcc1 and btb domain-containing protein 1, partial [Lasius niger]